MSSPSLGQEVYENAAAGDPGQWVHSVEQEDAIAEIREAVHGDDFPVIARWDCAEGLKVWVDEDGQRGWAAVQNALTFDDALAALPGLGETEYGRVRVVSVFLNAQLQLAGGPGVVRVQKLLNYLYWAETQGQQRLIVVSTAITPPDILEARFTKVTHHLPDREKLREILHQVAVEEGDLPEEPEEEEAILDAAKGMTRSQTRAAFSKCLVRKPHVVTAAPIFGRKAQDLKGNDLGLSISTARESIDKVVGYEHLKMVYRELMENAEECRDNPELKSSGVIVCGISGAGKSMILRALGESLTPTRPTIQWKQAMSGSPYVSKGAHNTDAVTQRFEAYAPCNVLIDEGGKSMSANVKGGEGSAVQAQEQASIWLDWHETTLADVFIMVSMNEEFGPLFDKMPEYGNRFEDSFFVDYPTSLQKDHIWIYQLKRYQVIEEAEEYWDMKQRGDIPEGRWWVGRNIKKVAKQARKRGRRPCEIPISVPDELPDAAKRMRDWAVKLGLLSTEYEGLYNPDKHEQLVQEVAEPKRDTVRKKKAKKAAKV